VALFHTSEHFPSCEIVNCVDSTTYVSVVRSDKSRFSSAYVFLGEGNNRCESRCDFQRALYHHWLFFAVVKQYLHDVVLNM